MTDRESPAGLRPNCPDCGHRISLHHEDGCRALLLGKGRSRACGCTSTLPEILGSRYRRPPEEVAERRAL